MISSHTGFQPLREVWLGDVYPSRFYSHYDNETQDVFSKITELTQHDLTEIENCLTKLGVIVRRPNFAQVDDYLDDQDILIKPPITPRDWAITIGDTLYIAPQYPSGVEPYQTAIDQYINDNQHVCIGNRDENHCDDFCWVPFPSVVRVGRDLYIDYPKGNPTLIKYVEQAIEKF